MKNLYLIGGAMGVGKTSVCRILKEKLDNSVLLDGDWCWDMHPFRVTDELKAMVMENIAFLLNNFIKCSAFDSVVFCWVLHEQAIWDALIARLDTENCRVHALALVCGEEALRARLNGDVAAGLREADVVQRSLLRLPLYAAVDAVKIDTTNRSPGQVADLILRDF